ncbi:hypothetical protein VTJ04DRAFT_5883 [Mycothermus thermophilus]|uniref:uncharacterized protein n=1 Tax=Humicola insolens TaxID=85995 RepID=UPI003743350B
MTSSPSPSSRPPENIRHQAKALLIVALSVCLSFDRSSSSIHRDLTFSRGRRESHPSPHPIRPSVHSFVRRHSPIEIEEAKSIRRAPQLLLPPSLIKYTGSPGQVKLKGSKRSHPNIASMAIQTGHSHTQQPRPRFPITHSRKHATPHLHPYSNKHANA